MTQALSMKQQQRGDAKLDPACRSQDDCVEVLDGELKNLYKVPMDVVSHMPPEHLNITRLVLCRNYEPGNPDSCPLGAMCKFVHVECFVGQLERPAAVHVKYCWHHQDECSYTRLPAGEMLRVSAPNNRMPFDDIPSEMVLATRGALNRHTHSGQLSHCAHYFFNNLCKRGSDCHFIHAILVAPKNVPSAHFPRKSMKAKSWTMARDAPAAYAYPAAYRPRQQQPKLYPEAVLMEEVPALVEDSDEAEAGGVEEGHQFKDMVPRHPRDPQKLLYRHNPYSFKVATVYLLG